MKRTYPHLTALRLAALLAISRIVLVSAAAVTGIIAIAFNDALLLPAFMLVAASVVVVILSFASSWSLRCVRCNCPLFLPRTCGKHPGAKSTLGSHLIEMSLDILFGTSFRCMYCAESCGCRKSKHSRPRHAHRQSAHAPGASTAPLSPRMVSRVLGRAPSAANQALPTATFVPELNLTRPPAPFHAPAVPRAPYPSPRTASASPFESYVPATAARRATKEIRPENTIVA